MTETIARVLGRFLLSRKACHACWLFLLWFAAAVLILLSRPTRPVTSRPAVAAMAKIRRVTLMFPPGIGQQDLHFVQHGVGGVEDTLLWTPSLGAAGGAEQAGASTAELQSGQQQQQQPGVRPGSGAELVAAATSSQGGAAPAPVCTLPLVALDDVYKTVFGQTSTLAVRTKQTLREALEAVCRASPSQLYTEVSHDKDVRDLLFRAGVVGRTAAVVKLLSVPALMALMRKRHATAAMIAPLAMLDLPNLFAGVPSGWHDGAIRDGLSTHINSLLSPASGRRSTIARLLSSRPSVSERSTAQAAASDPAASARALGGPQR